LSWRYDLAMAKRDDLNRGPQGMIQRRPGEMIERLLGECDLEVARTWRDDLRYGLKRLPRDGLEG